MRMLDAYKSDALAGRAIWKELEFQYQIKLSDMIIFWELEAQDLSIAQMQAEHNIIANIQNFKLYIISYLRDIFVPDAQMIYLEKQKYEQLRKFYLLTVFHPRVRFFTVKEPFGNMELLKNGLVEPHDYTYQAVLKVR